MPSMMAYRREPVNGYEVRSSGYSDPSGYSEPSGYFEPSEEEMGEHLDALRLRLRSRTADFPLFQDNWNWNDKAHDITFGMIVPPA